MSEQVRRSRADDHLSADQAADWSGRQSRVCSAVTFSVKDQNDLTCHRMPPQLTFMGLPQQVPAALGGLAVVWHRRSRTSPAVPIVRPEQWCGL